MRHIYHNKVFFPTLCTGGLGNYYSTIIPEDHNFSNSASKMLMWKQYVNKLSMVKWILEHTTVLVTEWGVGPYGYVRCVYNEIDDFFFFCIRND
jgi:hypothetical protein